MQRSSRLWAVALTALGAGLALQALLPGRTTAQPTIEGGIPPPVPRAPGSAQPGAEPAKPGVLPQPGQPVRPGTLPVIPPGGQRAGQPGAQPMTQFTGGQRYTVVESQGVNLLVVDNASSTLYFYTCDQNKEAGSELKLRGSIDLNQVGQQVIRPRGHPAEQPNQPAQPNQQRTPPPTSPNGQGGERPEK
jgi:hypothetical protein